jgi:hypothetical protein
MYLHRMLHQPPPAETDILCESCGYTLNGLPESGNCPECGTPIALSTTASPRHPPAWEGKGMRRLTTFLAVLTPRAFFRTINIDSNTRQSRWFAVFALIVSSIWATLAINLHYLSMTALSVAPYWLPRPWFMVGVLPIVIFASQWIVLELVGFLSALEGKYWGYRTPRTTVRRTLHYLTPHASIACAPPVLVAGSYLWLLFHNTKYGFYMAEYLYLLSASVVVMAIYLFKVYWSAMKSTLFANRVRRNESAPANADPAL